MSDVVKKIKEDIAGGLQILSDPYAVIKDDGAVFTDDGELLVLTEQGRFVVRLEPFDVEKKEEVPVAFAVLRVHRPDSEDFNQPNTPAYVTFHITEEVIEMMTSRMSVLGSLSGVDSDLCSIEFWDDIITPIALKDADPKWAEALSDGDCMIIEDAPIITLDPKVSEVTMIVTGEGIAWSLFLGHGQALNTTTFDPRPFP